MSERVLRSGELRRLLGDHGERVPEKAGTRGRGAGPVGLEGGSGKQRVLGTPPGALGVVWGLWRKRGPQPGKSGRGLWLVSPWGGSWGEFGAELEGYGGCLGRDLAVAWSP